MLFSKPLTYGIALEILGQEVVHQYVGQEPSGRMFNELVLDHNSKWFNHNHIAALEFQLKGFLIKLSYSMNKVIITLT